jgi:hypothetical protein
MEYLAGLTCLILIVGGGGLSLLVLGLLATKQ